MSGECGACRWFRPGDREGFKATNSWDPKGSLARWLAAEGAYVAEHGWTGRCQAAPQPVEVRSAYGCARWEVDKYCVWDINARASSYRDSEEAEQLRKELKAERERSRARYRKLQELRKAQREVTK